MSSRSRSPAEKAAAEKAPPPPSSSSSRWDRAGPSAVEATLQKQGLALPGAAAAAAAVDPQTLLAQQRAALLSGLTTMLGAGGAVTGVRRKQCEIYVGNLTQGVVTAPMLRDLFGSLVSALPAFDPSKGPAVTNIQMCSNGCYAFVEFREESLASTALKFHGLEVAGRRIKIGRPTGYVVPPTGDVPGLDVPADVLRELGVSGQPSTYQPAPGPGGTQAKKQRELYVGNLAQGLVTVEMLRELFTEPLRAALGGAADDPVLHIELEASGKFGFVEFRDEHTATLALGLFNNMDLCGRPLRVGRPQGYIDAAGAVTGAIADPFAASHFLSAMAAQALPNFQIPLALPPAPPPG